MAPKRRGIHRAKTDWRAEHLRPAQQSQPFTPDTQTKVYSLESLNQRNAEYGHGRRQWNYTGTGKLTI